MDFIKLLPSGWLLLCHCWFEERHITSSSRWRRFGLVSNKSICRSHLVVIKHSSGKNDGSRHVKTYECPSFSIFFHIFSIYHPTIWESFWVGIPRVFPGFSGSDLSGMAEVFRRRCRPEATRSAATATGQNVGPGSLDFGSFVVKPMLLWGCPVFFHES